MFDTNVNLCILYLKEIIYMTITLFELITGTTAIIGVVWAVASTFYRPKDIDLTPIYAKLEEIAGFLAKTREAYVPKNEFMQYCSSCKQENTNRYETLSADIKDLHGRIDEILMKKKG